MNVWERAQDGLTPAEFRAQWAAKLDQPMAGLDRTERKYVHYARYNWDRSQAIEDAYAPSERLREALASLDAPQRWMVLTEDWCADSSFTLPVILEAAAASTLIDVRILPRDAFPEVMDRYLTNGGRSIPKLVAFAEDGTELFQWGPRPATVTALREQMQADGADARMLMQATLAWYAEDGGRALDEELAEVLSAVRVDAG